MEIKDVVWSKWLFICYYFWFCGCVGFSSLKFLSCVFPTLSLFSVLLQPAMCPQDKLQIWTGLTDSVGMGKQLGYMAAPEA